MLAPAKSLRKEEKSSSATGASDGFSPEKVALYERRYEDGYNIADPEYEAWRKLAHPATKSTGDNSSTDLDNFDTDSLKTHLSSNKQSSRHNSSLGDILVLPKPKPKTAKSRQKAASLNSMTVCLSDSLVLEELKSKDTELEKLRKKQEREEKKRKKLEEADKKKLKQLRKKQEREEKRVKLQEVKKSESKCTHTCRKKRNQSISLAKEIEQLQIESDYECHVCHLDIDCTWIGCDVWLHLHCTCVRSDNVPDKFYCDECTSIDLD